MGSLWFNNLRKNGVIGLDLGTHGIRMMQLQPRGDGWTAVAACRRALPRDLPEGHDERHAALAPVLQQMLATGGFTSRSVVSCLGGSAIQYKNLRLPKMPDDELMSAVELEASDRLGLGAKGTVVVQYFNAGDVRQGEEVRQELVVMAASTQAVESHVKLLTMAGLTPVAIDAAPAALVRCLSAVEGGEDAPATVVLDVGYTSTKVVVAKQGRIAFFKVIDIGGQRIDQAVASKLNLSVTEAADLRHTPVEGGGEPSNGALFGSSRKETVDRALYEAIRLVGTELAREIGLCVRYYSVTFRGARPDKAMITGGGAHEPMLAKVLQTEAGLTIEPALPVMPIELDRVQRWCPDTAALTDWALSVGLATRPQQSAKQVRTKEAA